jgi:hypothetical protein
LHSLGLNALLLRSTDIPRKPNYDFERRERERVKAQDAVKKAQAKADRRAAEQVTDDQNQSSSPHNS